MRNEPQGLGQEKSVPPSDLQISGNVRTAAGQTGLEKPHHLVMMRPQHLAEQQTGHVVTHHFRVAIDALIDLGKRGAAIAPGAEELDMLRRHVGDHPKVALHGVTRRTTEGMQVTLHALHEGPGHRKIVIPQGQEEFLQFPGMDLVGHGHLGDDFVDGLPAKGHGGWIRGGRKSGVHGGDRDEGDFKHGCSSAGKPILPARRAENSGLTIPDNPARTLKKAMNKDPLEKVTAILREVLDQPSLVLTGDTTAADVEGWDSFAQINLIMGLEDAYQIQFSTEEIGRMGRVSDLISLIESKLR